MQIITAQRADLRTVCEITETTIRAVYPHYYPKGAVDFFLAHHKEANIHADIANGDVYLLLDEEGTAAATVTIRGNELCRLFVLPEQQGRGYGRALLDFAENAILEEHPFVRLDASLPAKRIYLNRGYIVVDYDVIRTPNGDHLCYETMHRSRE